MDKIKKFIDCYIPIEHCNFECHYCYIPTLDSFEKKTKDITYEPDFIRKALSKERLGGVCMFNLCAGGETLLSNKVVPIAKELTDEGHYVMIVTNGTVSPRFDEMKNFPEECRKRLFIKFSFHYLELKRLKLMEKFFENVNKMKVAGISYTIEVTPNDEYIPFIQEIKDVCIKNVGAVPHITVARVENGTYPIMSKLTKQEYINIWSTFDSTMFDFKIKVWGEKRKEFCYAGAWCYVFNIASGDLKQCYRGRVIQNLYEDINTKIIEEPIGCYCNEPHCFNSHAFLVFGAIPELKTPTFADERNRLVGTKDEWLKPEMKEFMSDKLFNNNDEYTEKEKEKFNKEQKKYYLKKNIKKKIKKIMKKD